MKQPQQIWINQFGGNQQQNAFSQQQSPDQFGLQTNANQQPPQVSNQSSNEFGMFGNQQQQQAIPEQYGSPQ